MSERIQVRRGTEAERLLTVFAQGEPIWCYDSLQLYLGDGVTLGGKPVRATDMSYVRNAFSNRFNEQTAVNSVVQALDTIFQFTVNVADNFYYGDVTSNVISDANLFFSALSMIEGAGAPGPKDLAYVSNYTYRAFAYPTSFGMVSGIQDPGLGYQDILATFAAPITVTYAGIDFYVYMTLEPCLNTDPKTIRYIL